MGDICILANFFFNIRGDTKTPFRQSMRVFSRKNLRNDLTQCIPATKTIAIDILRGHFVLGQTTMYLVINVAILNHCLRETSYSPLSFGKFQKKKDPNPFPKSYEKKTPSLVTIFSVADKDQFDLMTAILLVNKKAVIIRWLSASDF